MISVLINGIGGQMGHAVYNACLAYPTLFKPVAGVDMHPDVAGVDCPVYPNYDDIPEKADIIIDFSVPAALPAVLRAAQRKNLPVIIGTTGLGEKEHRLIDAAAVRIPVFQSGNMSLGVNLQMELSRTAAATLGSDFDVEIIEKHHRKKIDAPSGTALMLADCISSQFPGGMDYEYGRHEKNKRRTDRELGIHSIRGGTVVGEHQVLFIGNDEVVEITHQAFSKQIFARGALRAAMYMIGKGPGRYNMQNVVTEHDVASHLYTLEDQAVVSVGNLPGDGAAASDLFAAIASAGVSIDMIAMSLDGDQRIHIGFSLQQEKMKDAVTAIKSLLAGYPEAGVRTRGGVTKLTIEGSGMALKQGVAAQFMGVLNKAGVAVQLITTSETKIECCVDTVETTRAIAEIQKEFSIE